MQEYLDLARQGKNDWWRFILAVLVIFFMWQGVGAIPTVALILWTQVDGNPQTGITPGGLTGINELLTLVAMLLASVFFLLGIWMAVRLIHGRRFLTLVSPRPTISLRRIGQGFIAWLVLAGLLSLLEAVLYPGRYVWTFDLGRFASYLLPILFFIPIQTSTEELFFRAYLLQGAGLRVRNLWVLCLLSGVIFGLPHLLNPEAQNDPWLMAVYYIAIGAVMAYVTLRDGRLELALGLHAANNLFSAIVANYSVSILPTPAFFTVNTLDAVYSVTAALVALLLFILMFFPPWRKKVNPVAGE